MVIYNIVINNQTGLLSESRDSNGLANNIEKVLTDEELQRKLSDNCRYQAINNYSMEKFVRQYIQIFRSAIEK